MPHLFRPILELPLQWRRDWCKSSRLHQEHKRAFRPKLSSGVERSDRIVRLTAVPDMHYVAILYNIFLAFQAQLALGPCIGL